jgi:hypothetical protein
MIVASRNFANAPRNGKKVFRLRIGCRSCSTSPSPNMLKNSAMIGVPSGYQQIHCMKSVDKVSCVVHVSRSTSE